MHAHASPTGSSERPDAVCTRPFSMRSVLHVGLRSPQGSLLGLFLSLGSSLQALAEARFQNPPVILLEWKWSGWSDRGHKSLVLRQRLTWYRAVDSGWYRGRLTLGLDNHQPTGQILDSSCNSFPQFGVWDQLLEAAALSMHACPLRPADVLAASTGKTGQNSGLPTHHLPTCPEPLTHPTASSGQGGSDLAAQSPILSADLKAGLFKESEIKASPNGNKAIKNANSKQQRCTGPLFIVGSLGSRTSLSLSCSHSDVPSIPVPHRVQPHGGKSSPLLPPRNSGPWQNVDEENSGEVTQTTDQGILNVAAPFWAERGVCVCTPQTCASQSRKPYSPGIWTQAGLTRQCGFRHCCPE
ncbi:hypothetical protein E5288_WYG011527 [Bos mutus]|uniref:Uncharacterized protein n=1 Tax=Bos mutus TaxID=72004 RepID=A0A6B0RP80_9CETA|nr:hypothetical protein [Bos mutus]